MMDQIVRRMLMTIGIHSRVKGADAIYGIVLLVGLGMLIAKLYAHPIVVARSASSQISGQPQTTADTRLSVDAAAQRQFEVAFQFLQRQMTLSTSLTGQPEPGLASLTLQQNTYCRLRCEYHYAVLGAGVQDIQMEFVLSDINMRTMKWEIDGFNRAFISFQTVDGSDRFWRRFSEFEKGKVTEWPNWERTSQVLCRAQPDADTLPRVVDALSYIASACGARDSPF